MRSSDWSSDVCSSDPPGPLVLGAAPLKSRTPTADRDRTVSRRSTPSSRTSLNGEQPYPWDLLQPKDEMSRHRGDRTSVVTGKSVSVRLDLGGRRIIKKKKTSNQHRTIRQQQRQ